MQVILAVSDKGRDHIPFRSSKLTHVLKDSLGGNCKASLPMLYPCPQPAKLHATALHPNPCYRSLLQGKNSPMFAAHPCPVQTVLVANAWGEASQMDETVSTCRFAQRMMCVTCEVSANVVQDQSVQAKQMQR